jgi:hypothetical protein
MSDPNTRNLISRMADELDHYRQLLSDDRREVHPLATAARTALAKPVGEGPSDEELTLTYAYAVAAAVDNKRGPFAREDAEAAQLAGLRAVLSRWAHPATPSAPDLGDRERLRIMEAGIRYGYVAGHDDTVEGRYGDPDELAADEAPEILGEVGATFEAMLEQQAPPAPEPGEVGEVVGAMRREASAAESCGHLCFMEPMDMERAATLLQQLSAPTPVVAAVAVNERLPGEGDCDAEGRCWIFMPDIGTAPSWRLVDPRDIGPYHTHWRPAHAIPLPQAGEREGPSD